MIGVVIPGTTVMTGGPLTSNMVVLDINEPKNVNNIGLFLQEPIPNDCGAGMYFSCPPYENLQFIGCVANSRPRKLERLDVLKSSYEDKIKSDINQEYAKRIAKNLFSYLDSYNQNQDTSRRLLVVPLNTLETWYETFLKKSKLDPNFFMKSDF